MTALARHARASQRSSPVSQGGSLAAGVISLTFGVLAVSHGGFSPVAWGWASVVLLALCGLSLLARVDSPLAAWDVAFVCLLFALFGWTLLSSVWSSSPGESVLESERALVYLAACSAAFLLVTSAGSLLVGVWAASTLACAYGVSTRLFPTRLGMFDPIAGYRLSEPIGYWNALGLFAAIGALLSVGVVARATNLALRAAAASSSVLLVATLYFTFSRGAWISLAAGLAGLLALDRRRLQMSAALLVVAPWAGLAVFFAFRSKGLTRIDTPLSAAAKDGRQLAVILLVLALGAGAEAALFTRLRSKFRLAPLWRRHVGALVLLVFVGAVASVSILEGSPSTLSRKAYRAFISPSHRADTNLNQRLFTLTAGLRIQEWRIAWKDYSMHPWLGSGAGTYQSYWLRYRPAPLPIKDAHNLYLETLAELGPIGLVLLLVALALPVAAAISARGSPWVAVAFGAYVAYVVDAAGEWDWELPAVTLAALLPACGIFIAAREGRDARRWRLRLTRTGSAAALVLMAFAFVGLVGNSAIQASTTALAAQDIGKAESQARKASRWMPWASAPWERLAQAQLDAGNRAMALRSFRRGLAKDQSSWEIWYDMALAASGAAQRDALNMAQRLNPLEPRVVALEAELNAAEHLAPQSQSQPSGG